MHDLRATNAKGRTEASLSADVLAQKRQGVETAEVDLVGNVLVGHWAATAPSACALTGVATSRSELVQAVIELGDDGRALGGWQPTLLTDLVRGLGGEDPGEEPTRISALRDALVKVVRLATVSDRDTRSEIVQVAESALRGPVA